MSIATLVVQELPGDVIYDRAQNAVRNQDGFVLI